MTSSPRHIPSLCLSLIAAGALLASAPPALGADAVDFAVPEKYGIGYEVESVEIVDLNGDGLNDAASSANADWESSGNYMILRLQQPDGTLGPPQMQPSSASDTLASGDIVGDEKPELIADTTTGVYMFRWDHGGLGAGEVIEGGSVTDDYLDTADLDQDGDLDIVDDVSRGIRWLRNDGGGHFTAKALPIHGDFIDFRIADLGDDGRPDVVVSARDSGGPYRFVTIHVAPGGTPVATEHAFDPDATGYLGELAVGDLTHDGSDDLVRIVGRQAAIDEQTDGSFDPLGYSYPTAGPTTFAQVVDIDGDGLDDLLSMNDGSEIGINLGVEPGELGDEVPIRPQQRFDVGGQYAPEDDTFDVGDLNNDGRKDILATSSALTVLRQKSAPAPPPDPDPIQAESTAGAGPPFFTLPYGWNLSDEATALDVADVNGDGADDLVAAADTNELGETDPRLFEFQQTGGGLRPGKPLPLSVGRGVDLVATDLIDGPAAEVVVSSGSGLDLFRERHGHLVGPAPIQRVGLDPLIPVDDVVAADMDPDGTTDLVTASASGGVEVLRRVGSRWQPTPIAPGTRYRHIAVGDINGDSRPDVAGIQSRQGEIGVHLSTPSGGYDFRPIPTPADRYQDSIAIGDVTGDGRGDLVVGDREGGWEYLRVYSAGAATESAAYQSRQVLAPLTLADINGDGALDALAGERTELWLGTPGGGSLNPVLLPAPERFGDSSGIAVGDLTGDGLPDIATGVSDQYISASLFVMEQRPEAPPETNIRSAPDRDVRVPVFEFDSPAGNAAFECQLDYGTWKACTSPQRITGITEGIHTIQIRAVTPQGGYDFSPFRTSVTVDVTPPETSILRLSDLSGTWYAEFESSDHGRTFECRLDGAEWAACDYYLYMPGLSQGGHSLDVRATDRAGNVDPSPVTRTWTVTAPGGGGDPGGGDPGGGDPGGGDPGGGDPGGGDPGGGDPGDPDPLRDADGDGVPDTTDYCPLRTGPQLTAGCPVLARSLSTRVDAKNRLQGFVVGDARCRSSQRATLSRSPGRLQVGPQVMSSSDGSFAFPRIRKKGHYVVTLAPKLIATSGVCARATSAPIAIAAPQRKGGRK